MVDRSAKLPNSRVLFLPTLFWVSAHEEGYFDNNEVSWQLGICSGLAPCTVPAQCADARPLVLGTDAQSPISHRWTSTHTSTISGRSSTTASISSFTGSLSRCFSLHRTYAPAARAHWNVVRINVDLWTSERG